MSVLLLEAGGEADMTTVIPGMSLSNLETPLDWHYVSTPQLVSNQLSKGKVRQYLLNILDGHLNLSKLK